MFFGTFGYVNKEAGKKAPRHTLFCGVLSISRAGFVLDAKEFGIAQALGFPLCILMGYGEYMYDMYIHQISI